MGNKIHGDTNAKSYFHKLYGVWSEMRDRCKTHPVYLSRGITVCAQWEKYILFKEWAIKAGYSHGLTIDRINNDLGYFPENCRWTDRLTQSRNSRWPKKINGKFITDLANELGLHPASITKNLNKGYTEDKIRKMKPRKKMTHKVNI